MKKGSLLYEGKAKRVYETENPHLLCLEYKDEVTALNGKRKEVIAGKGRLNNEITSFLFLKLEEEGVATHFVRKLSPTEQVVKKAEMLPLEVVVRNVAAGSLSERLGIPEGTPLRKPLIEYYYKNDDLGDPLVTEAHIEEMRLATNREVGILAKISMQINEILTHLFSQQDIMLVDYKLEFGRDHEGFIVLADEISPDTCRLWDVKTNQRFDKDIFRRNLGNVTEAYEKVLTRLGGSSYV